jgi:FkbM family methyltransferase
VREIVSKVDWDCEVHTLFREKNLGCKAAVGGAITWFFERVEKGIILEDDCLPHPTFFSFCEKMLGRYKNVPQVSMIGGFNIAERWNTERSSYFFSKYGGIWGWATWKDRWQKYDPLMKAWPLPETQEKIKQWLGGGRAWKIKRWTYASAYNGHKNSWGYPWEFIRVLEKGLTIVPSVNLIKNIGFDSKATHTTSGSQYDVPTHPLDHLLNEPQTIVADNEYDAHFIKTAFDSMSLKQKIISKLGKVTGKLLKKPQTYTASAPLRKAHKIPRFTASTIPVLGKDFHIADSASFSSAYQEIFLRNIYRFKSAKTNPTILDCGANVGVSVLYFKTLFPEARITAFEPDPNIASILKKNISSYSLTNVEVIEKAISDKEGTINFQSDGADGGHISNSSNGASVSTVRLGSYLNQDIDFLKIDIEGAEDVVIPDIAAQISRVKNIFIEYHSSHIEPQSLHKILQVLNTAGFRYHIQHVGVISEAPFFKIKVKQGFDNQLNIYAFRQ